jgi:hypothetical protein
MGDPKYRQYTKKQIEKDYLDNGRSIILEKIIEEKARAGVIAPGKTQKAADVWLTSARWWKRLQIKVRYKKHIKTDQQASGDPVTVGLVFAAAILIPRSGIHSF